MTEEYDKVDVIDMEVGEEVGLRLSSNSAADELTYLSSPGVLFEWKAMTAFVRVKDDEKKDAEKQVLHGVSGSANAGEVLAILGPSGVS